MGLSVLGALVAFLLVATSASADIYGGGGSSRNDCLLVFDAALNHPVAKPRRIRCTDGDPTCDSDGVVNGVCQVDVSVCGNSSFNPTKCTLNGIATVLVDHALDNGDKKFDPDFQALQARIDNQLAPPNSDPDSCTTPIRVSLRIDGPTPSNRCKRAKKNIGITTFSQVIEGKIHRDRDKLRIQCLPAPDQCDPALFFSGTYDRIQKQVFDASCARSGCHDSESQTGGLLLEQAGSYTNLVDADPSNPLALGAGWKRVTTSGPMSGDLETSYLYHKVTGDLGVGFGERMPFGSPKLKSYLIDIIELWILAGAPETGWVPGTD